jgi:hypothetical protein
VSGASIADCEFGCPFVIAYVGRCNRFRGESGYCSRHASEKCSVCGGQASRQCSYAGQFVCGAPLCKNCEGWEDQSKSSGAWGFLNHSHRRKPVDRSIHGLRYMAGADLEEAGCTVAEIEAVLGHHTFKMAMKYASQRLRARAANAKREAADGA